MAESRFLQLRLRSTPIDVVKFAKVDIPRLVDQKTTVMIRLKAMMRHAQPGIWSALLNLQVEPTVLIVDPCGTEDLEIIDVFKLPKYVFAASNEWFLLGCLHKEVEGEFVDHKKAIRFPGCKPVHPEDLVDLMLGRKISST